MRRFVILIIPFFILTVNGLFTAVLAGDKKSSIDWDSGEGVMIDVFPHESYRQKRLSGVRPGLRVSRSYDEGLNFIYDDDLWWFGSPPRNMKVYHVPPFITHLPYKKSPLSYFKKGRWFPEKNNSGYSSYETPVKKLDDLLKFKVMD